MGIKLLRAVVAIVMVIATGTANGQSLKNEIKSDSQRTYMNIGTKYFITPPAPNMIRTDSDYVVRVATLNTMKKIVDTLHNITTSTTLQQILTNGDSSSVGFKLGKSTGLNPFTSAYFRLDANGFPQIVLNDTSNNAFMVFNTSSGASYVLNSNGRTIRIETSSGNGISTFHLGGTGSAPAILMYGGSGNAGQIPIVTSGTDLCGVFSFTTGLTPTLNDTVARIFFATTYASVPTWVKIDAADNATEDAFLLGQGLYVPYNRTYTNMCFIMNRNAALTASTVYTVRYEVSR